MFDLFGNGARARVKALEESLSVERARTEALTLQLLAITDARAHRAVTITPEERERRYVMASRPGLHRAGQIPNHNASIAAARDKIATLPSPKES